MKIYSIKPISTEYKGVVYRSRLEAKWAVFFDKCGWRYQYEPCEYNGWFPDFVIYGDEKIYVEVKPVMNFPHDVAKKIENSGVENEVLILGETFEVNSIGGGICDNIFGWLYDIQGYRCDGDCCGKRFSNCTCGTWSNAVLGLWENQKIYGFCSVEGYFADRISGCYDGGCHGGKPIQDNTSKRIWAESCNLTQWKKTKGEKQCTR